MPQLFLNRKSDRRLIRPIRRNAVSHKVEETAENKDINNQEMDAAATIKKIMANNAKAPKRRVKVEKKDKGLIERTDESTIVLTEDNKMMLTD